MKEPFTIDHLKIDRRQLFLIGGPCVIENPELTITIAERTAEICRRLKIPFIFKASFDKANRTSISSYRGPGLNAGLEILAHIKNSLKVPVLSDIHESWQANKVASVLSVIQIPAFLCRQTDLLLSAADTGLPVNIKKSQMLSAREINQAVEKIVSRGNNRILLTERGTFFGYNNLVVDFRNIPLMKQTGFPVVIDATHSVQQPGAAGRSSGGQPEFIDLIARLGVMAGADGVFLEVHPEPQKALSDGANSLNLAHLEKLLLKLIKIFEISKDEEH